MVSEMVLRCLIGGEGRAQALEGDIQRPGSQPWENGSFLVLQIQRDSHAFPVLAVQGLVASALSTLVPFRRIPQEEYDANQRTYAHELLEAGDAGRWIRVSPHIPLPPMLFSRVSP